MARGLEYSKKELEYIKENYEMLSDYQLAQRLKRTEASIEYKRLSIGLKRQDQTLRLTNLWERQHQAAAVYHFIIHSNSCMLETAKILYYQLVSHPSYIKEFNKQRIKKRNPNWKKAEAIELYYGGMPVNKIAKKLSLSRLTIWKYAKLAQYCQSQEQETITLQSKINT